MPVRNVNVLTLAAALFLLALLIIAVPSFLDPEFEVINESSEAVSVVASWHRNDMQVGELRPMASRQFSIDDEATITFKVRYQSGKEVSSEPLYFTSGSRIVATVSDAAIEARYDF